MANGGKGQLFYQVYPPHQKSAMILHHRTFREIRWIESTHTIPLTRTQSSKHREADFATSVETNERTNEKTNTHTHTLSLSLSPQNVFHGRRTTTKTTTATRHGRSGAPSLTRGNNTHSHTSSHIHSLIHSFIHSFAPASLPLSLSLSLSHSLPLSLPLSLSFRAFSIRFHIALFRALSFSSSILFHGQISKDCREGCLT